MRSVRLVRRSSREFVERVFVCAVGVMTTGCLAPTEATLSISLGESVLGAVVVYSKLNAYVVMVHFMVGIALLTVAVELCLRAAHAPGRGTLAGRTM